MSKVLFNLKALIEAIEKIESYSADAVSAESFYEDQKSSRAEMNKRKTKLTYSAPLLSQYDMALSCGAESRWGYLLQSPFISIKNPNYLNTIF